MPAHDDGRTLDRVTDDLAQYIADRPGWEMHGAAAVMTDDSGWTARVPQVPDLNDPAARIGV